MGNDAIWEDSLDNSAEIIWCCNPLFCKLAPSPAKAMVLWSAFEKHSPTDHPTRFPSRPPFQPLSCCHFSFLCIAFFYRKDCDLFKAQLFFSQKATLSVFSFLVKWNLCQELSTKLGTPHEVAVWKIMIAHNNQHAFRQGCVFWCFIGDRRVRKRFRKKLYVVHWDDDDERIALNLSYWWQL